MDANTVRQVLIGADRYSLTRLINDLQMGLVDPYQYMLGVHAKCIGGSEANAKTHNPKGVRHSRMF